MKIDCINIYVSWSFFGISRLYKLLITERC